LHDHFGEFLVGFAHSTKSWMVCVTWRPPKVELGGWLQWFVHIFSNSVSKCVPYNKKMILVKKIENLVLFMGANGITQATLACFFITFVTIFEEIKFKIFKKIFNFFYLLFFILFY
jgi:hypothetical protein